MAIEDALVLATLLGEYWEKRDGHVEAFYLYEVRGGFFRASRSIAISLSQIFTRRRSCDPCSSYCTFKCVHCVLVVRSSLSGDFPLHRNIYEGYLY